MASVKKFTNNISLIENLLIIFIIVTISPLSCVSIENNSSRQISFSNTVSSSKHANGNATVIELQNNSIHSINKITDEGIVAESNSDSTVIVENKSKSPEKLNKKAKNRGNKNNNWKHTNRHFHQTNRSNNKVNKNNDKRKHSKKYSIDELLNTTFARKISNDIDWDPCKASGFMGDIALPDDTANLEGSISSSYSIVASTEPYDFDELVAESTQTTTTTTKPAKINDSKESNKTEENYLKENDRNISEIDEKQAKQTTFNRKANSDDDADDHDHDDDADGHYDIKLTPDLMNDESKNNNNNNKHQSIAENDKILLTKAKDIDGVGGDAGGQVHFNKTFQHELEILKQEVYNEGLQVEEEGLTDIIRKKTKLPSSNLQDFNEKHRNDPLLSINEPIKASHRNTHQSAVVVGSNNAVNLKSGINMPHSHYNQNQHHQHHHNHHNHHHHENARSHQHSLASSTTKLSTTSPSTSSLKDKSKLETTKKLLLSTSQQKASASIEQDEIEEDNRDTVLTITKSKEEQRLSLGSKTNQEKAALGVVATIEKPSSTAQSTLSSGEGTQFVKSKGEKPIDGKAIPPSSHVRNVDLRKIQSNTKDIEDDSGNNFVSEKKFIILPTSLPVQRSTAANVFSNAGGNGGKLDDIEFLQVDGPVRRRHRRGRRQQRRSNQASKEYRDRLQRLKEELNHPVATIDDTKKSKHYVRKTSGELQHGKKFRNKNQDKKSKLLRQNYSLGNKSSKQNPIYLSKNDENSKKKLNIPKVDAQKYGTEKYLNYSSELYDRMDVISKRKSTLDAITDELNAANLDAIIMNNEKNTETLKRHHRVTRAVTAKKERVWDYGVIPYEIDGNFSGSHKALFKQAMRHWENFTCIKFVERDPEVHPNYIIFTIRNCGCCSFVGKRGNGGQAISIGRNCDKFGIVVHELGHVVGFWHEHTRPDRDSHVVIENSNIMKGQNYNFNMLTSDDVNSLGQPYDYDSIMHYARNTFSKGTYLDTILPIEVKGKKRPEIGQRIRLSQGDIAQANLLYRCPKCGRTFQENVGTFSSPSYQSRENASNVEKCEWRITATHGERIVLKLENLNLFKSEKCQTDYLEIRDGYWYKSPLLVRKCGKIASETIVTNSSRMLISYVNTHRNAGYRGFRADFEAICGGELFADSEGRLESPNYPLEYLPNKECIWKITAVEGFQVALKFQSFEVENHDNCVYDYVEVRDGDNADARVIGIFCGYKPPPNMKSTTNKMWVKFVSDSSVQKAGFSAIFMKEVDECVTTDHGCAHTCTNTLGGYECSCEIGYELHSDKKNCEDACGGVIEATNGTITSPSFPDLYPALKDCVWEIIAPQNYKISLNFTHFDLEGTNNQHSDCGYDSVTIFSKMGENGLKRIETYCGTKIPPIATSESNALRVEFKSDKSVQKSGFAAIFFTDIDECATNNGGCQQECKNTIGSYICSCHNGYTLHDNGLDCKEGACKYEISDPYGGIYSPNYPDSYPPNVDCIWHFQTTPGHRIKLIFNEFDVESHPNCAYDHVTIYDGESEHSSKLGIFCGDKIPYPIASSSNEMYMALKTDKNKERKGFQATHSTSCGGYLIATVHIQQFYSHARYANHHYDDNMECEWTIKTSPGSNVQLFFNEFDIEESPNCTYDFVEIYAGMEDTSGPLHGRYCGDKMPQEIISLGDSLLLRFRTDDSFISKGFSASYVSVEPLEDSEDSNSESLEMNTPFPGYLKSIYKSESSGSDVYDYIDNRENVILHQEQNRRLNGRHTKYRNSYN